MKLRLFPTLEALDGMEEPSLDQVIWPGNPTARLHVILKGTPAKMTCGPVIYGLAVGGQR